MTLDLIPDVFQPVADHVESCLRDHLKTEYSDGVPATGGLVVWFREQVVAALGNRVKKMNLAKGPDLVLYDENSDASFELIAATDLRVRYLIDGARRYCDNPEYPTFAGCLFLGRCPSKEYRSKIDELQREGILLQARQMIPDADNVWVVGLLVSSESRFKPTQEFNVPSQE